MGTDDEEVIDKNASKKGKDALNKLTGGVLKTAAAFGFGLPNITKATEAFGAAGKAAGYLESQLTVFENLTKSGVTFGGQLDQITIQATNARMTQEELAKVVKEQSGNFTMLGSSVEGGFNKFLKNNADFYDQFGKDGQRLSTSLMNLGMGTDQINESLLYFEQIQNAATRRNFRADGERNQKAFEFAKEMDKMAKLTGKQRDQIMEEQRQIAARGEVQAKAILFEQQFGERGAALADEMNQNILGMKQYGSAAEQLAMEVASKGVAFSKDAKNLAVAMPDAYASLQKARQARESGDAELAKQYTQQALAQMSEARKNGKMARMAILSGTSSMADTAKTFYEETSTGLARTQENIRAELEKTLGRKATPEELAAETKRVAEEDQKMSEGTAGLTKDLIGVRQSIMDTAEEVQVEATARLYKGLTEAADPFVKLLTKESSKEGRSGIVAKVTEEVDSFLGTIFGGEGITGQQGAIEKQRSTAGAVAAGDADKLLKMRELEAEFQQAGTSEARKKEIEQEINKLQATITTSSLAVDQANIVVDNANFSSLGQKLGEGKDAEGRTSGSPGASAYANNLLSIAESFGKKGTNIVAHNNEVILNEGQIRKIDSAIGSLMESAGSMGSNLQGKVSSIRPPAQSMASSMAPQFEQMQKTMQSSMPDLQSQMSGFAEQMKGPLESLARNMEEQLTVTKKGVNINDKQLKSAKAMIGNVFGGIGFG